MKFDLYTQTGEKKGSATASDAIFKVAINQNLVRSAVLRQRANGRQVSAHVKTRGEVRGGGKKPWRQKGTGRARFGSSRNPIWRGGGVAFGPRNTRNFTVSMNRKERRAALFSVLSHKAEEKQVFALDEFKLDSPKTKAFSEMLKKLPENRSLLVVLEDRNEALEKSASNLANVKVILVNYLNPHDLLVYDKVMFLEAALKKAEELFLK